MRIILEDIYATIKIGNQHEDSLIWLKTKEGQDWLKYMSKHHKGKGHELTGKNVVISEEHYEIYKELCAYVHPSTEKYWTMILNKEFADGELSFLVCLDFGRIVHSICLSLYLERFPKLGYKQKDGCSICGLRENLLSHRSGFGFVCSNCLGIIEDGNGDSLLYYSLSRIVN